jgi:DedD protein
MGLKSFFQRKGQDETATPPARGRRNGSTGGDLAEAVQQARTKARQRLIGAAVLLGIGIIGFPLLFETQPRPIPVDLPIEIPRKEGVPPLQLPPPRATQSAPRAAKPAASAQEIVESAADAGREVPPPASAPVVAAAPAPDAKPAPKPAPPKPAADRPDATEKPPAHEKPPEARAAARPAVPADDGTRAKALLEGKPAAAEGGRFVVQVGAFSEAGAARETRLKVEKLGLKTYTQVVETDAGKRIRVRVGPFGSRDEADKAASKIKAAGLSSAVLTL